MSCEHCTDPDGKPCFPVHGLAPHTQDEAGTTTGFLPTNQWPTNFVPDAEDIRTGTYFCPQCGDGKEAVSPDDVAVHEFRRCVASLALAVDGEIYADVRAKLVDGLAAAIRVGKRQNGPDRWNHALGRRRRSWTHETPDGKRVEMRLGQAVKHLKRGTFYALTGFSRRESDMHMGFNYVSVVDGETYWRPIEELFDGRFQAVSWEEVPNAGQG